MTNILMKFVCVQGNYMTWVKRAGIFSATLLFFSLIGSAVSAAEIKQVRSVTTPDETDVEIRVFPAEGNRLLLGFACDEGASVSEEKTAISLAEDGIEVWMPDMLGSYMLPKARSSLAEIPTETLTHIIDKALSTGKQVYLIAGGPDTELILRAVAAWEKTGAKGDLSGAVLMFPRLNDGAPIPGQEPVYVDAVGKTRLPLMVLEGERTPNRWGMRHLTQALAKGGSSVQSKVIPDVRGYFFKRADANMPEEVVTSQLGGVIKASMFYIERAEK